MTRPAACRPLIRAHLLMDSEPLMIPDSTGEARAALAVFPGMAGVTVIGLGAGLAGQALIGCVVPSGPGLGVPGLRGHARKTLRNGSMPAAIMVAGEIPVTAAGTVKAVALPVPELSGLLPYQPPAMLGQEVLCELSAGVPGVAGRGLGSGVSGLGGRWIDARK